MGITLGLFLPPIFHLCCANAMSSTGNVHRGSYFKDDNVYTVDYHHHHHHHHHHHFISDKKSLQKRGNYECIATWGRPSHASPFPR